MNTRAFGHTSETMIIPVFDYMNYDPSKNCEKVRFVTFDKEEELFNTA